MLTTLRSPVKAARVVPPSPLPAESPIKRAGKNVQHLYRVIQKSTGAVGGYGHNGPVYGEITMGTFQKVVDALALHTGFDASSSFIDIGSGLGKPNMHVALNPGVKMSYGVELEELRYQLSMHNLRFVMNEVLDMREKVVYFNHKDATEMKNFGDMTHVYMFDVGFPPSVLTSLANAFNCSANVQALVSFQRPDRVISMYGFAVTLVDQIQTRMNGSTELHTAYIYRVKNSRKVNEKPRRQMQLDNFVVSKKDAASPTKQLASAEYNDENNSVVKDKLRRQPQVVKVDVTSPVKKAVDIEKKMKYELWDLMPLHYPTYITDFGVIGAPGERPRRSALATVRKF